MTFSGGWARLWKHAQLHAYTWIGDSDGDHTVAPRIFRDPNSRDKRGSIVSEAADFLHLSLHNAGCIVVVAGSRPRTIMYPPED